VLSLSSVRNPLTAGAALLIPAFAAWPFLAAAARSKFRRGLSEWLRNGYDWIFEQQLVESSSPLAAAVLRLLDATERITLAEVVKATGANRNTLKVKMSELVNNGLLHRHGRGRGVFYTRAKSEDKV
jgi:DNA-binding transcriptional ArsR family regulator